MNIENLSPSNVWLSWQAEPRASNARVVSYWSGGLIIAALNLARQPELWFEYRDIGPKSPRADGVKTVLGKGLSASLESANVDNRKFNVLCLALTGPEFADIFLSFADLLVDDVFEDKALSGNLIEIEYKVSKWMKFFKPDRKEISRNAVLGLIGELVFIKSWLDHSELSHRSWTGPIGEPKDFSGPTCDVEVKVCGSRSGPLVHSISSIDQLQPNLEKPLFLFSMRASLGSNKENKVRDLIESVRNNKIFSRDLEAADYFEASIRSKGLQNEIPQEFDSFEIIEEQVFRVDGDFPRLNRDFVSDIPQIVKVEYAIDLTGREPDTAFKRNNTL